MPRDKLYDGNEFEVGDRFAMAECENELLVTEVSNDTVSIVVDDESVMGEKQWGHAEARLKLHESGYERVQRTEKNDEKEVETDSGAADTRSNEDEADADYYVSDKGPTRHCPECGYEGTKHHPHRRRPTYYDSLLHFCPDENCKRQLHDGAADDCDDCSTEEVAGDGGAVPAITRVDADDDDEDEDESITARDTSDFSDSDKEVLAAVEDGNTTANDVHSTVDFSLGQVRGCLKNLTDWGYLSRERDGRSYRYQLN